LGPTSEPMAKELAAHNSASPIKMVFAFISKTFLIP
jgi:hypothetical protein